jgi:DNA-binding transcriptional LysR family regulator
MWLARFRNENPDVAFELSYGYGAELETAVATGRADLAIYPVGLGDLPPDLVFTPLIEATQRHRLPVGTSDPEAAYPQTALALLDYGWVSPPAGKPTGRQTWRSILQTLDMQEAEIVMAGGLLAGVLSFVAQTDCLTVLPEATVDSMGLAFELRSIPIATRTPRRPIGLLSRPDAELSHTARSFLRFMETGFRSVRAGLAVAPSGQVATEG